MATRRVITSGVAGTSPGKVVFNRLEINDFIKKEKQFSLYVQALARLMTVSINTPESFYQIAGIHGAPYVAYNGAGEAPHTPAPARFLGYCSHSSVLFPTWHRPYVALIEQEIQRLAMDIAKTYDSFSEDWIEAAVELRQPYWDWSSTAGPPRELYDMTNFETLQILLAPKGAVGPFPNPFLRYKFQAAPADFPTPFDQPIWRDATHRWGEIVGGVVKDSLEDLDIIFSTPRLDNRKRTTGKLLLSRLVASWEPFSNDNQGLKDTPALNSLEALHAGIHFMLGGNGGRGHMSNQKVAGFDPFFFIHHAQTDRLVSLWAALHPDQWVTASHEPQGSWMLENTAEVNEITALAPFYCTEDGQYWTSADLHVPTDGLFGYSYPDFNDVKDWGDTAAVQALVKSNIEKMYPFKDVIMQHIAFDAGASLPLCPPIAAIAAPTRAVLDWVAHITVKKNALGCGFVVFVFLGDAPADPEHYNRSANLIGDFCAFVNETPEMCANCIRLGNVTIGGAADLNDALIERGAVANLHPDEVVPYLRRELRWRVWTGNGPSVHPSDVEELEIDVSATPHYLDEEGEVQVGVPVLYHEVTRSMPGGCRHSGQLVDVA